MKAARMPNVSKQRRPEKRIAPPVVKSYLVWKAKRDKPMVIVAVIATAIRTVAVLKWHVAAPT